MNRALLVTLVTAVSLARVCAAAPADSGAVEYGLKVPPSAYQYGCFGPCTCPVIERPTYGSFDLVPQGSDGLYAYYAVERYIASFNNGPGAVAITGSGRYRVGGEVAYTQQLVLDLSIEGRPLQHFDSGMQPVSVTFPRIHIQCAAHGFGCMDTVIVVDAAPVQNTTALLPGPRVFHIQAIEPNPFDRSARLVIDVARTSPVRVEVFDLRGRRVRQLWHEPAATAGRHSLTWDGNGDDGRSATAGVYWLRMTWPGGSEGRRIAKLH